jgi:hypothetical protein
MEAIVMVERIVSQASFRILMEWAGLKLTERQFEELRTVYPKLLVMTDLLRRPRSIDAEPATVFVPFLSKQ